jgi:N-acetylneuraminate synthase
MIKINQNIISNNSKTYFIADIAANFDGDIARAKDLIYLAAEAGADAAKFQNFLAKTIVSDQAFKTIGKQLSHQADWKDSVYDVYDKASLPILWTETLRDTCADAGIDYITTPYDLSLIPILSEYVSAWKVGSGDITWHEMIRTLSLDDKPLLIATGASNMNEVELAMSVALENKKDVVLMQCNTNYTASLENFKYIELNVLKEYRKKYPDIILGLSDHTPGHSTVLGSIALGAKVIEKHFTDDNDREGPDHKFSMNPRSWRDMVDRSRELEYALGTGIKKIMDNEKESVVVQRRGLCASHDLEVGRIITSDDLIALRPCINDGIEPYKMQQLIGKKTNCKVVSGENITKGMFV